MAVKAETSFSLADELFNADKVRRLGLAIGAAHPAFDTKRFRTEALARFPDLALKERIQHLVDLLTKELPSDFVAASAILQDALPEPLDPSLEDDDFGEFIWVVPGEFVARHGVTEEHLVRSLGFLREATKRFSSENAIRPFLARFPRQTMAFVHECAGDSNYHVRRLASEGIRPLLPWAPRVKLEHKDIVSVLDRLYTDPTRYVVRSVANTLNDIAKLEPPLVTRTLTRWSRSAEADPKEFAWLKKHSLRTLTKQDDPAAFKLLGYTDKPKFRLAGIAATETVKVGDSFEWQGQLTSLAEQKLRIMLNVHFLKASGKHSAKRFLIKDGDFRAGEKLAIRKRQTFRPMTTRTLYPGEHFAELIVNGVVRGRRGFRLTS
ncbi:MAG: DNA alkylation repair protein [Pseudomonadota bacterium]